MFGCGVDWSSIRLLPGLSASALVKFSVMDVFTDGGAALIRTGLVTISILLRKSFQKDR